MTGLFGLRKRFAAVPVAGALVVLGAFTALANGSGAPVDSLQQCQDSTGATCTSVQETSALAVHRQSGPVVAQNQSAVILTLGNLGPGNYIVTAKANLAANNLGSSRNAQCSLVVSPPGGAQGTVDSWSEADTAGDTTGYVANIQRPVTLNDSLSTSYTIQLVCSVNSGLLGWNASDSSIIANQVQNLAEQEVNS